MNGDLIFLLAAIAAFIFLPMLISKLSQVLFKRYTKFGNPISENYKDDRIQEEMVSAKALLDGVLRNG